MQIKTTTLILGGLAAFIAWHVYQTGEAVKAAAIAPKASDDNTDEPDVIPPKAIGWANAPLPFVRLSDGKTVKMSVTVAWKRNHDGSGPTYAPGNAQVTKVYQRYSAKALDT